MKHYISGAATMDKSSTGLSSVLTTSTTARMNALFGIDPIIVEHFAKGGMYTPDAAYQGRIRVPVTERTHNLLKIAELFLIGKHHETNAVLSYFLSATRRFGQFFALPASDIPHSLATAANEPYFHFFKYNRISGQPTTYVELTEEFCPLTKDEQETLLDRHERSEPSELYTEIFPEAAQRLRQNALECWVKR